MQLFYSQDITGSTAVFDETESLHAIQVLRLRNGDPVHVTDGRGKLYEGKTLVAGKKSISATDLKLLREEQAQSPSIHLVVSPLRNVDRLEWLVEKAVELGVASITPVITQYTVKKGINEKRLQNIVLSAMKQSLRLHLPEMRALVELKNFCFDEENTQYCFGYCSEANKTPIKDLSLNAENIVLMIGPEGDFSVAEADFLLHHKCVPVSLGDTRLRTETAAIYALSALKLRLDR